MRTLILFSSRDGHTREIAHYVATRLRADGEECEVMNLHRTPDIDWANIDKVIIGASIRYGHFHSSLDNFVKRHASTLNQLTSAFFAVNLVARKPEKRTPQTNSYTRKFLSNSPWSPSLSAVFAGALRYPKYRWYDRLMILLIMKMTGGETDTHKEVVYTDWAQVDAFTHELAHLPSKRL